MNCVDRDILEWYINFLYLKYVFEINILIIYKREVEVFVLIDLEKICFVYDSILNDIIYFFI